MPKRIYIADSYSLNTGDIGILEATIESLELEFNEIELVIESSHPKVLKRIIGSRHKVYARIFDVSEIIGGDQGLRQKYIAFFTGVYDSLSFFVYILAQRLNLYGFIVIIRKSRRLQALDIKNSDVWLSSGGGFLSSQYYFVFRIYGYLLAIIGGKPLIIFAQSIGPFNNIFHQTLVRWFLNRAVFISIREPYSYKYVKSMNLKPIIHLTSDVALLLDSPQVHTVNEVSVCVKVSDTNYVKCISVLLYVLLERGFKVNVVSQTPADDELAADLCSIAPKRLKLYEFGLSPRAVTELYARSKFIVASRMHALIFATNSNTPWIGISYGSKFDGLLSQLSSFGTILNNEDLTIKSLLQAIDQINDKQKLKSELDKVRHDSQNNITLLKSALY